MAKNRNFLSLMVPEVDGATTAGLMVVTFLPAYCSSHPDFYYRLNCPHALGPLVLD